MPAKLRIGVGVVVAALAAGVLAGCSAGGSSGTASGERTTFTMGTTLGSTIDPVHADQTQADNPDQLFYDPLLSYDSKSALVPRVAASWKVAPDATSITLTLRSGVTFHDGTPLTPKDVVFTLDRLHKIGTGVASLLANYASAEASGSNDVVIHLSKPDTTVLGALSRVYVLNAALVTKNAGSDDAQTWLATHEAGSGPYTLSSFTANSSVIGARAPKYWDYSADRPGVFKMSYLQESTAAKNALQSGGIDLAQDMTPRDSTSFDGNATFTVTPSLGTYQTYAFMNTQAPALKDVRVREAISLAFDYKGAFKQVFGDQGAIGDGPLPKYLSCRASLPESTQDIDKAKQLVQEAGAQGTSLKIYYQPSLSQLTQLATLLASNLEAIGIKAELQATTFPQYLEMLKSPATTPDIAMVMQNAPFPDPGSVLPQTYGSAFVGLGSNFGQYSNPAVDKLLGDAVGTADESARCDLYKQAQETIAKDYVSLNIALGEVWIVSRKNVTGVVPSPVHVYFNVVDLRVK